MYVIRKSNGGEYEHYDFQMGWFFRSPLNHFYRGGMSMMRF